MTTDPTTKILSMPNGARFHRCALQVNPHHYSGTFRGAPADGDAHRHAAEIVSRAKELGITVLAITDHNDVSGVDAFKQAAWDTGIQVLPGFELSSSEGIHILCLYPQDSDGQRLGRYLGECGITNPQPSSDLASKSFVDILEAVRRQGGVAIAAHVSGDKGLLTGLSGQACIKAWQSPNLLAIQIPGAVEDLPQEFRAIVENKNPDYRRSDPASEKLAVAVVNAKDVASAADLAEPTAACLVKMSEVGIEGLRQAFLDPGSRIRLNAAAQAAADESHAEILAMSWQGGFLDGVAIRFNPNLNVLVGGRGTGKSTIVESIRAALGLDPVGDDARKTHEGIVRHVLKSGTKVSLVVRACRPSPKTYVVERTIPNPPIVRDVDGTPSNLTPRDLLPGLEVFGQHEISELSKSREKLTRLLDRFVQSDDSRRAKRGDLIRRLEKNRRSLVDARKELDQVRDRLAALPGLEETLQRFKEAGLEERLKEQSLLVREEQVLESVPERLAPFRDCLESLGTALPIDKVFLSPKALQELPAREVLARAYGVVERFETEVTRLRTELERALQTADRELTGIRGKWDVRRASVQASFEKILRELQKSRIDGEEFIRLRRQIETLRPLREREVQMKRLAADLVTARQGLVTEWEDFKAEESRRLDRAAKKVNHKLRNRVQVQVTAAGDREPLFSLLRASVGGRLTEAIDSLRVRPDLSLPQFVEACQQGPADLVRVFGLTQAQADRLAKADADVLMRIEELDLVPTTSIQLNTAAPGDAAQWQTLEELSTGQKATAVLLLLLLESEAPLIVDQPEDDLDNRFITDGVVPRMREEKQRRQFIFSTHNANIPVLGDAELIVGLSAAGEAEGGHALIAPDHVGSIDSKAVRELVEEILEGGREAFERRRRKYGF